MPRPSHVLDLVILTLSGEEYKLRKPSLFVSTPPPPPVTSIASDPDSLVKIRNRALRRKLFCLFRSHVPIMWFAKIWFWLKIVSVRLILIFILFYYATANAFYSVLARIYGSGRRWVSWPAESCPEGRPVPEHPVCEPRFETQAFWWTETSVSTFFSDLLRCWALTFERQD
jgi:hypothetical protein